VTPPSAAPSRRIFYLHGFASSAQSTKGAYLARRLAARGIPLNCPDFNEPDFESLTMTRMLRQLEQELEVTDGEPPRAALIGSSLGGALAILAAARWPDVVDRLVLLAPAVMFAKVGHHLLPPDRVAQWRRAGAMPFFHFGYGEERNLKVGFYDDSLQYDAFTTAFAQPTLIFQGRNDRSVDPRTVELFARTRPNVTLTILDDDHQLVASLPAIWAGIESFLNLAP